MNPTPFHHDINNQHASTPEQQPPFMHPAANRTPGPQDAYNVRKATWSHMLESSPANISPAAGRLALKEMLETVAYIILIFVIVRSMVQNFKIEGSSMEPSLHSEQYILVNKLVYFHIDLNAPLRLFPGFDEDTLPPRLFYPLLQPERGDVVVFEYPGNVEKDYIKRVIALPGETVEFRDGQVFVNGVLLDEAYLQGASTNCNGGSVCNQGPTVVPEDSIFVMGDNRANSSDSRAWGPLKLERVIGQAWLLYYPVDDWGLLPDTSYASDKQRE